MITYLCKLTMRFGDHLDDSTFRTVSTRSSNVVLVLDRLRYHGNPLVDWAPGKLVPTRCPPSCDESFCRWPCTACDTLTMIATSRTSPVFYKS
ncbi:hypothetical protein HYPSUDRAFT_49127 [Hypholoma sublateritium FD-334 SS-4]|uniref:Uncharacterized protein n=1 Tax=Hypholoma sublateritium (strain FD-334 SS-4) TaxID=945553 RepID=A0A0D2ND10_HYPSF|nr:hypothetical protein HYPSUDRAFT_49127 [Hypholoma sublateritium FD-334 SS-4]